MYGIGMSNQTDQELVLTMADAWSRIEGRLDRALSNIKGISFREYRLLRTITDAPGGAVSRVDLATAVGVTPSGATRALQPLAKLGFVKTTRGERDARLALATLTDSGRELVADASGVIDDTLVALFAKAPKASAQREHLMELLDDLA